MMSFSNSLIDMNKLLAVILLTLSVAAHADCFDDAAAYHNVNPWILRAIAAQESSFRPNTVVRNKNNSIDVGATGINSVHFPELAKYGIRPTDLLNGCNAVYVAGWLLRRHMDKAGNTWEAVGWFRSRNNPYKDEYIADIQKRIADWQRQGLIQ